MRIKSFDPSMAAYTFNVGRQQSAVSEANREITNKSKSLVSQHLRNGDRRPRPIGRPGRIRPLALSSPKASHSNKTAQKIDQYLRLGAGILSTAATIGGATATSNPVGGALALLSLGTLIYQEVSKHH